MRNLLAELAEEVISDLVDRLGDVEFASEDLPVVGGSDCLIVKTGFRGVRSRR